MHDTHAGMEATSACILHGHSVGLTGSRAEMPRSVSMSRLIQRSRLERLPQELDDGDGGMDVSEATSFVDIHERLHLGHHIEVLSDTACQAFSPRTRDRFDMFQCDGKSERRFDESPPCRESPSTRRSLGTLLLLIYHRVSSK